MGLIGWLIRCLVCDTVIVSVLRKSRNTHWWCYHMNMKKTILRDALRIAREKLGNHPQLDHFPHYSFIVQGNKIIEWATNSNGVPPVHLGYHKRLSPIEEVTPKSHAEFNAWKKAKGILNQNDSFECINIRLNKNGEMKMSAPCSCCKNFLLEMGCTSFHFTTESGWAKII